MIKKDKYTKLNEGHILLDSKLVIVFINKKALGNFSLEKKK